MAESESKRSKSPVPLLVVDPSGLDSIKEQLKKLARKRGTIRTRLTYFKSFLQNYHLSDVSTYTTVQIKELSLNLARVQELASNFDAVQLEIEDLSENLDEQLVERDITQRDFDSQIALAQVIIDSFSTQDKSDRGSEKSDRGSKSSCCHSYNDRSIQLPTINLPTFDGNYIRWLEFRDLFKSLIHDNDSIAPINKFHYLRQSLNGSASIVIRSIDFSANNYELAWNTLCDRYNNKNILINNHLKAIVNLHPIQKESYGALRYLCDQVFKNLSALNSLDISTTGWDPIILYLVSAKLDPITGRKWEDYKGRLSSLPTLLEFKSFLQNRANTLETSTANNNYVENKNNTTHKNNRYQNVKSFIVSEDSSKKACLICNKPNHLVHQCYKFRAMNIGDRLSAVSKLNLCQVCLRRHAGGAGCTLKGSCRICRENHNTALHVNNNNNNFGTKVATSSVESVACNGPVSFSVAGPGQVLLCTARVEIINKRNNRTYLARALLDSGSQASFITDDLKQKIGLVTDEIKSFNVSGISNVACGVSERCDIILKSRVNSFTVSVNCFVLPKITGTMPNVQVDIQKLMLPDDIVLADPSFHEPSEIDMLLGADIFFDIICPAQMKLGPNKPILQQSLLGWIVAGPTGSSYLNPTSKIQCNFVHSNSVKSLQDFTTYSMDSLQDFHDESRMSVEDIHSNVNLTSLQDCSEPFLVSLQDTHYDSQLFQDIDKSIKRFWEVEELPSDQNEYSTDEQFCETHFIKNTCRLPDGRFSVMMPLKEVPELALGNSFPIAMKRFINLERKLNKNENIKKQYSDFIQEYGDLGHLREINRPEFGYFLPHHCVIKEQRETTRLRVVYDASAQTSSGKSLNDLQALGPVVQNDLFSILLRFRTHKFVLTADINKFYRQVSLHESQRNLQLILWRDQVSQPIKILQLQTVTYGMASAPFLSTRCLIQLANECPDPVIANVIKNDFYIDDLNTGSSSTDELKHIYLNVTKVLDSACFPLRKFRTNCPQILNDQSGSSNCLELHEKATVLGLKWSPKADQLHFPSEIETTTKVTKRTIISTTCKLFDPLGLVSCCVIKPKILLQNLWSAKLNWDDPVPEQFARRWDIFLKNLHHLSNITIPRCVLGDCSDSQLIELHCFVDASQQAYGACVYLRSFNNGEQVSVWLLCAKSRVAPIKTLTIPRLELTAALLGAQLTVKVLKSIPYPVASKYMWTDSTVVLGWLKTQSKNLQTFVRNRVNKINELTLHCKWNHVPTNFNPADLASRGIDPQSLQASILWWEGPSFLKEGQNAWPAQPYTTPTDLPEIKILISQNEISYESYIKFSDYSSFLRLKRSYAYVLRFINNCQINKNKLTGPLQVNELERSLIVLIKQCQAESFLQDIKQLKNGKTLHCKSKLLPLDPFLDANFLLRVGGRLSQSDCEYDKKYPIVLDAKHHLTKLILQYEHLRLFHAGPQLLLSSVRENYWPIGGRILARSTCRSCVVCARMRGQTIQPKMGDLPYIRISPDFPFNSCGIDFAGPFMISSRKGRGNRITKAYLCVFVCLVTKAIHLEVVSDLSTDAFLSCLRRFVSRRGKPYVIYCDNGKNFVGANNELGRVIRSSRQPVFNYMANESIKFMFSPAYSPHFGGIWESGVRCAKFHLKRVAGNASLTFEELSTLFTQIEAILNSRPISPLSSDPTDLSPLTPGHFLIGRPLMSVPSPPITVARPNRYQRIEQIRQLFWERWRREFMAELQNRSKWRRDQPPIQVGDLVLLKDDNLAPLHWRMGRVSKLYEGKDNICRVADVYTAKGTVKRAVNRMCLLPLSEPNTDSQQ